MHQVAFYEEKKVTADNKTCSQRIPYEHVNQKDVYE